MAKQKVSRADRLSALRDKMKSVKMGGTAGFFTPKEGRSIIRIMPEVGEMEFFFQEVGRHYMPDKKIFYCPSFTSCGELECPVCEIVQELYKSGDEASKALIGQIRVRRQYWMNVIDRDAEDRGPLIYTPGVMVFGAIKNVINDPDYGDIMDEDDGVDVVVTREGKGLETSYEVLMRRKAAPLSDDPDQIDEWMDAAKDLSWVEVSENPEEDEKLSEGHSVFLLPYDRLVIEAGLDEEGFLSGAEED